MNVLLLNPPAGEKYMKEGRCQHKASIYQSVYPPLTLAYIAAAVRKRGENKVVLVDAVGLGETLNSVKNKVRNFKPDLVVVNVTTPTIENDLKAIQEIHKGLNPECRVCVYGVHATYFARKLAEKPYIDVVTKGEPEEIVYELTYNPVEEVRGIVYRKPRDNAIVENPDHEPADLDALPYPAWDLVDLDGYRMPVTGERYVLLNTGRGCPYQCTFCVSGIYYGRKVRSRSVESIIGEIEYVKRLGVNNFFFFEETFTINRRFVMELCDKILEKKLDIRWVCNSRVDTVDREMLSKMKAAGCWMMSFGIESNSQEILDNVKKGIKVEDATNAVKEAHEAGIATVGHFILGLKGETQKTIEDTIKFSLKLPLDFAEYYISTPYPGSQEFEDFGIEDHDKIDWSRFEYSHNISNKDLDLETARNKAYRRFYLRPKTVLNMLRVFGFKNVFKLIDTGLKFILNV